MRPLRSFSSILLVAAIVPFVTARSTDELKGSATKMAQALKAKYSNFQVPEAWLWWQSGLIFDAIFTYGATTGDKQYQDFLTTSTYEQATDANNFMLEPEHKATGNDDQAWWAHTALTAHENNVPVPAGRPSFLALAQNVLNQQETRWDNAKCNGGLKWKIKENADGWHYKSTITNVLYFQLAARIGKMTGDAHALDLAEKSYNWMENVGLIADDFQVYDGTDDAKGENGCVDVNHNKWSYNAGMLLYGTAVLASHYRNPEGKWNKRTRGILDHTKSEFIQDGALFERKCEGDGSCDKDQLSFTGILGRCLGATAVVLPALKQEITELLDTAVDKVQERWNESQEPMDHYKSLEIVNAAIRARGNALVPRSAVPAGPMRRGFVGRVMVDVK